MKNLLPKLEELTPITNSNSTFYECGFNEEFSNLKSKNPIIAMALSYNYFSLYFLHTFELFQKFLNLYLYFQL